MGRPKETNPKAFVCTVRFTQDEKITVRKEMEALGYKSFSHYLRDLIFKKTKYRFRGKVKDRELLVSIDEMTAEIKKIGVNYNQLVKSYNRLHKARALTVPVVDDHLSRLDALTKQVFEQQQQFIQKTASLFEMINDNE